MHFAVVLFALNHFFFFSFCPHTFSPWIPGLLLGHQQGYWQHFPFSYHWDGLELPGISESFLSPKAPCWLETWLLLNELSEWLQEAPIKGVISTARRIGRKLCGYSVRACCGCWFRSKFHVGIEIFLLITNGAQEPLKELEFLLEKRESVTSTQWL